MTVGGQTADTRTQELTGSDGKTVAKANTEQDTTGALKNNFDLNEIQTGLA